MLLQSISPTVSAEVYKRYTNQPATLICLGFFLEVCSKGRKSQEEKYLGYNGEYILQVYIIKHAISL